MADKNTLKQWFVTGAKPLQAQYWAWLDSYWHKSEAISINNIENLSEILVNKADADQLALYAKRDASNIDVPTWKTRLGVGELPPNIGTIDYTNSEGFSYVGNAYKKVEQPNDGKTYLLKIDGTAVDGDTFGKNVSNSYLTSLPNTGLKLGAIWELDSNGFPLRFKNLPDKSADSTFNLMLAQDSSGQIAKSDGKNLLKGMPSLLSDAEKTTWKTEMNGGWTTNTMSVGLINPPVFKYENQPQWITLLGANLNLNPANFSVEIMNEAGTVSLVTIPNSQVQLINSTTLVFWFNFYSLVPQKFKIRLWNGIAFYTTPIFFEQAASLTPINFTSNLFLFGGASSSPNSSKNSDTDANLGTDSNLVALGNNSIPVAGLFTDAILLGSEDWTVTLTTREISYYADDGAGSQISNIFGLIEGANTFLNENFSKISTTNSVGYKANYYLDAAFAGVGFFYLQREKITSQAYIVTYIKRGSSLTKIRRKTNEQTTYISNDTIDTSKNYSVGCVKRNSNIGFSDSIVKFQITGAYKLN